MAANTGGPSHAWWRALSHRRQSWCVSIGWHWPAARPVPESCTPVMISRRECCASAGHAGSHPPPGERNYTGGWRRPSSTACTARWRDSFLSLPLRPPNAGARYRVPVEYIPIASLEAPRPVCLEDGATLSSNEPARLWFYGNAAATSKQIMLDHLRSELFELLEAAVPSAEFHQAGSYIAYDQDVIDWLHQKFRVHGFLEDPAQVFRAGDLCLVPYQKDTGFRTKIPELCGYGVIPVGYPISFACCPEMRHGENCVMASTPHALAEQVAEVCADVGRRSRLAAGAIETRRTHFSDGVLLQKYQAASRLRRRVRNGGVDTDRARKRERPETQRPGPFGNNAGSDLLSHTRFPYSGFAYCSPLRGSPAVPADGRAWETAR